MAVTSTTSAQLIAVSSIVSLDIYHTYLRPSATPRQIIRVSQLACIGFAIFASAFSTMLYYIGISLTWTLYFLGLITCPAMVTLALTVLWKKQTWWAAVVSPVVGMAAGIAVWLATAKHYGGGKLDVTTTGELLPCMWGTIAAAFIPAILSPVITLVRPDPVDFKWEKFNQIKLIAPTSPSSSQDHLDSSAETPFTPVELPYMNRQSLIAGITAIVLFVGIWIVWPFAMYGANYEFSKPFFTGWVVVAIIWAVAALLFFTFLPLWEGRKLIAKIVTGVVKGKIGRDESDDAFERRGSAGGSEGEKTFASSPTRSDTESITP